MVFDRRIAVLFSDDIEIFTGTIFKVARIDCIGPKIADGRLFIEIAVGGAFYPRQNPMQNHIVVRNIQVALTVP